MSNDYFCPKKPSRIHYMCLVHLCLFTLFSCILAFSIAAEDYTLEYSDFGVGGAVSQTTDYEVVDLIKEQGVSSETQSSMDYILETTTGFTDKPETTVLNWHWY